MIDKEKLNVLVALQGVLETRTAELKAKEEEFERSIEPIRARKAEIQKQIDEMKGILSTEALQEFEETNKKQLTGGLGIREMQTLEYEESKAFDWSKEHNLCLKLDKTAFEKVAKTTQLDFIKYGTKKTVTFPAEIKIESIIKEAAPGDQNE